jgi:PAS domain S-box-containing protein
MRQSRRHEETEVLARTGGPWLSVSVDPLLDPNGEITQVVHVARDITERKRAEQILHQREAYLAEAQRLSHTGSWALDVATRKYIYWSEELFRIFGFDPQGGIGSLEEVTRRFHPEDLNRWKENFERSLREKVDTSCECRFMMPDGTVKLLHLVRHPVLNDAGEVVQLVGTTMDITERKRNEEALRRSEAYLAEAERINDTGTWAWNPAGGIQYWSKQCYRIMGFDPADGVPRLQRFLERVHPEDLPQLRERLQRVAVEKTNYETEYRVIRPSGEVRDLRVVGHPVFDNAGNLLEYVGTSTDITERKRNEEALRRSEAYLAESQRLSHTGSWAYDPAGETIHWSEEMFRIYDFDPQQGSPTRAQRNTRVHPEDLENVKQARHKMLYEKVDCDFEHRIVLPEGRVRHVHVLGHPVLSPPGEVLGTVGTTIDITERKRTEEALRRAEGYLVEAQRLTHTGAWATNAVPEPLYWSEELFRLYGIDPQQGFPTHEQAVQRVHPEDRDRYVQAFHRVIHEKVDSDVEFRTVSPDGTIRHLYGLGHPILNMNGDVVEVVGTTVDTTERKRAEEELREGETRFRTFVDHAGDALFVYDLEQKTVVDVNREACESLGYTRQELIGKTPHAFHPDSYQAHMESIAERAAAGQTVFDTHWHRRKDGTVFPVEVHTTLVSYTGRQFLLMVARDISERLQAEEQRKRLRQLEADMAHIARVSMMGELTASIAHEVNQPLSGIVSSGGACLRWLAADPPNLGEVREAVRRIVGAGKHAGEVIARIRALTKRTAAPQEKLDLNETIREVLPLVGDEAKRNKVIIRTQFADDIFPILGDQVQLQQVVLNLVMNGVEAMSSVGERERELVIITRNIDPEQVQVTVEDSGIGIDPNTIQKIFDAFYTTKSTGMGMGLSISRSILQHHGGRLWAAAKDGPGTSFHFSLPKYHEQESNAGV